jgi:lipoprotein-anchoring transpeptidase ErfK/SrfK
VRRLKYKFHASRKKRGTFLYRIIVVGLLIFGGWFYYQYFERPHRLPNPKAATTNAAQTNVARTPIPVPTPPIRTSTNGFPRPVQNVFEAQLALLQHGISSGSIDGVIGSQTRAAIAAFQLREKLPVTGELDTNTRTRLMLSVEPLTAYAVTPADLARLQPVSSTWLGKSQQTALDYETILELVSERFFAHPNLIRRLNPSVDWTNVTAGVVLQIPNAAYPQATTHAAFVVIHLLGKILEAFDDTTNLLAHFPCSIAQRVEKRPVGELHVAVVIPNPNYTLDPAVFPESPEAQQLSHKLVLPPGPNNPVGVAWIGLDRPGYGIHGTPNPEQVGRTESHGCFRLANWNAEFLLRLVAIGTPVYVEE